jgi:hypothetical protein
MFDPHLKAADFVVVIVQTVAYGKRTEVSLNDNRRLDSNTQAHSLSSCSHLCIRSCEFVCCPFFDTGAHMYYSKRGLNKRSTFWIFCATMAAYILSSVGFLATSVSLGLKIVNGSLLHAFETIRLNLNSVILLNRKHRSLYLGY